MSTTAPQQQRRGCRTGCMTLLSLVIILIVSVVLLTFLGGGTSITDPAAWFGAARSTIGNFVRTVHEIVSGVDTHP